MTRREPVTALATFDGRARRSGDGGAPASRGAAGAVAVAIAIVLSACVGVTPPAVAPPDLEIPAAWSVAASSGDVATAAASTSLARWWRRFDDPLLGELVAQALIANPDVTSAQAALRQARALRDVRAAGLLPTVNGSASVQRSRSGDSGTGNAFNAGFDASWELDVFGARRSALGAADADAQASAASLDAIRVTVAAEVAVTYIQLRGLQVRLAIARENLASQLEILQITEWRMQAGLVTSLVTEQARTSTEQVRAQIPVLETGVAQSRHALAVLTGRSPASLDATLAQSRPVPQAAADLVLSVPAQTLRQRPDVRAAERQVSAALSRVAQADAARFPGFQIGGSLGLHAATLGALASGGAVASALLGSVSVPLFDGGAIRAQVRAQQAALEQARVAYLAVVLGALKDVEDALASLRGNRERLLRLSNASVAAANAALLARQRFSSGLIDFQVVLETQRTLLSTQDGQAGTQADLSADHVRLYKALGGGWRPDDDVTPGTSRSSEGPAAAPFAPMAVNP